MSSLGTCSGVARPDRSTRRSDLFGFVFRVRIGRIGRLCKTLWRFSYEFFQALEGVRDDISFRDSNDVISALLKIGHGHILDVV